MVFQLGLFVTDATIVAIDLYHNLSRVLNHGIVALKEIDGSVKMGTFILFIVNKLLYIIINKFVNVVFPRRLY